MWFSLLSIVYYVQIFSASKLVSVLFFKKNYRKIKWSMKSVKEILRHLNNWSQPRKDLEKQFRSARIMKISLMQKDKCIRNTKVISRLECQNWLLLCAKCSIIQRGWWLRRSRSHSRHLLIKATGHILQVLKERGYKLQPALLRESFLGQYLFGNIWQKLETYYRHIWTLD